MLENALSTLTSLAAFIVALGILVTFHELGHFLLARWSGVKVLTFSIGWGRPIYRRRFGRDNTEFVVAWIPLGGFVKMLDSRESAVDEADLSREFNGQPLYKRAAIVAAGPIFNLVLAVFIYWVVFLSGVEEYKALIAEPAVGTHAEVAGFADKDQVLSLNGDAVSSWNGLFFQLTSEVIGEVPLRFEVLDQQQRLLSRTIYLEGSAVDLATESVAAFLGLAPWRPIILPVFGELDPAGAAFHAGFQPGDRVLSVNQQPMPDWNSWAKFVRKHPGESLDVELERDGQVFRLALVPAAIVDGDKTIGRIGAYAQIDKNAFDGLYVVQEYGPFAALEKAIEKTADFSVLMTKLMGQMVVGKASLDGLSGPIGIAQVAGQRANAGVEAYFLFLAMMSISLGVLNLLPIPVLDGGHLLFFLVEAVKGSPVSESVQLMAQKIGIFSLLMLMGVAVINDISRFTH